jgi:hypothetical protein
MPWVSVNPPANDQATRRVFRRSDPQKAVANPWARGMNAHDSEDRFIRASSASSRSIRRALYPAVTKVHMNNSEIHALDHFSRPTR